MLNHPWMQDPPEVADYVAKLFATSPNPKLIPERVNDAGRAAWRRLHTEPHGSPEWLAEHFKPMIPAGCGCKTKSEDLFATCPPRCDTPEEWFAWTVEFHNMVNATLDKQGDHPQMPLDVARHVWRYDQTSAAWPTDPDPVDDWVIVTSLSPLPHHRDVQSRCVRSWQRLGVRVFSGNTPEEIAQLASLYPEVQFEPVRSADWCHHPRVFDLLQIGGDSPRLVINSDIEILGDGSRITAAARSGSAMVGIRYNWTGDRGDARREWWGLDAFLLHPDQIATLPDIDFAIGQTMWDWWIPYHLQQHEFSIDWVGEPCFYHESHELHWTPESLAVTRGLMSPVYGTPATHRFWEDWRLAQPFART